MKQAVELCANLCRLYYAISVVAGALQATGWPAVVGVMANWFGKGKRGLVMGIWSSHTCVGNIIGSIVAAQALSYGWGWSFILPGCMLSAGSVLVYALLVEQPADLSVGRQVDSPRMPLAQAIVRFCDLALLQLACLRFVHDADCLQVCEQRDADALSHRLVSVHACSMVRYCQCCA